MKFGNTYIPVACEASRNNDAVDIQFYAVICQAAQSEDDPDYITTTAVPIRGGSLLHVTGAACTYESTDGLIPTVSDQLIAVMRDRGFDYMNDLHFRTFTEETDVDIHYSLDLIAAPQQITRALLDSLYESGDEVGVMVSFYERYAPVVLSVVDEDDEKVAVFKRCQCNDDPVTYVTFDNNAVGMCMGTASGYTCDFEASSSEWDEMSDALYNIVRPLGVDDSHLRGAELEDSYLLFKYAAQGAVPPVELSVYEVQSMGESSEVIGLAFKRGNEWIPAIAQFDKEQGVDYPNVEITLNQCGTEEFFPKFATTQIEPRGATVKHFDGAACNTRMDEATQFFNDMSWLFRFYGGCDFINVNCNNVPDAVDLHVTRKMDMTPSQTLHLCNSEETRALWSQLPVNGSIKFLIDGALIRCIKVNAEQFAIEIQVVNNHIIRYPYLQRPNDDILLINNPLDGSYLWANKLAFVTDAMSVIVEYLGARYSTSEVVTNLTLDGLQHCIEY